MQIRKKMISQLLTLSFMSTLITLNPSQAFAQPALERNGKIELLVSVDWEGRTLSSPGLKAMKELRAEFPELSLLQFLNAAYFTKPGAEAQSLVRKISQVIRPQDELGLHIHGWKSLFEASGVRFRSSPTFWGSPVSCDGEDCGHDVPISHYPTEDLRKVIRFSTQKLESLGFGHPKSFRAGGWLASQNVLDALALEGFKVDSSSVPPRFLAGEIGSSNLFGWVQKLWSEITPTSQPSWVKTSSQPLLEVPDNGALADYMTSQEMVEVFMLALDKWKKNPSQNILVQIGFHQETAGQYLGRVRGAIREILRIAEENRLPLVYAPLPIAERDYR